MLKNITLKNIWTSINVRLGMTQDVYFVSGMCYSCSVFDDIELPKGFNKHYIEWEIPQENETLRHYSRRMSKTINTKRKFTLVGYSFGGIIVQEMVKFLKPEKVIIISSMKDEQEIPSLFQIAKKVNFVENLPMKLYATSNFMLNLFNRYVYNAPTKALGDFMTMIDPVYIKWSLAQITNWVPATKLKNIYHIHGTKDQVFSYENIIEPKTINGGDHLMVVKRAKDVSIVLGEVLKEKIKKLKSA